MKLRFYHASWYHETSHTPKSRHAILLFIMEHKGTYVMYVCKSPSVPDGHCIVVSYKRTTWLGSVYLPYLVVRFVYIRCSLNLDNLRNFCSNLTKINHHGSWGVLYEVETVWRVEKSTYCLLKFLVKSKKRLKFVPQYSDLFMFVRFFFVNV